MADISAFVSADRVCVFAHDLAAFTNTSTCNTCKWCARCVPSRSLPTSNSKPSARPMQTNTQLGEILEPQGICGLITLPMKFTCPGHLRGIAVETRTLGPLVRLSARDRGMGFDMTHHDRIFAISQRLHRPNQIAGTGIGLAWCTRQPSAWKAMSGSRVRLGAAGLRAPTATPLPCAGH